MISVPRGGRYRHVLYVCESARIKTLVETAARDLRVGDFVLTMLAPPARFNRSPERTTRPWPARTRRRVGAPVDVTETSRVAEFNDVDGLAAALASAGTD